MIHLPLENRFLFDMREVRAEFFQSIPSHSRGA